MKNNKNSLILILLFVFSILLNLNFGYYQENNYRNLASDNQPKLKKAGYWEIGPIEINDDDPAKNWTLTEALYEWCNGSGMIGDPFVIENVTINATGASNGIFIENSNAHFIIRNCTVFKAGSRGIKLKGVDNGVIYNNTLYQNPNGIDISTSNFINISNNYAVDNFYNGIELGSFCGSCTVSGNVLINNNQHGIKLRQEILFCNITNNMVTGHIYSGIQIQGGSNYNNILFNIVKENPGDGISIYQSHHNNFSLNSLYNNKQLGIILKEDSSNNIVSQNTLNGCGIGFDANSPATISTMSSNSIEPTNLVNGKMIAYYKNEVFLTPDDFINSGQVILLNCRNSLISNLNLSYGGGISLYFCDDNEIIENIIDYNYRGISLKRSDNNSISANSANHNEYGIYLYSSDNNLVLGNSATNNEHGIFVENSNNNTITQNTANNNEYGIHLYYGSLLNSILGNRVNYNNYGIFLFFSDNNLISGNSLIGNNECISEMYCEGNIFSNNDCGAVIQGYNIFLLIWVIPVFSTIIIQKKRKNKEINS